jgi:hypothetical protein
LQRAAVWENNAAREGRRKTFRRQKITTIWNPSEKALLPVTFSPSPAIAVNDDCRIGQYLNRVKPKMVNSGGCGTDWLASGA